MEEREEEFKTSSPTPATPVEAKPQTYLFLDALKEVINGRRITRVSWDNNDFVCMNDRWLSIFGGEKADGKFHQFIINEEDILGDDWIILPEGN